MNFCVSMLVFCDLIFSPSRLQRRYSSPEQDRDSQTGFVTLLINGCSVRSVRSFVCFNIFFCFVCALTCTTINLWLFGCRFRRMLTHTHSQSMNVKCRKRVNEIIVFVIFTFAILLSLISSLCMFARACFFSTLFLFIQFYFRLLQFFFIFRFNMYNTDFECIKGIKSVNHTN